MTTDGSRWEPERYKSPLEKSPLEDALDRFGGAISLSPTETLDEFLKRYDAARKRDAGIPTNEPKPNP